METQRFSFIGWVLVLAAVLAGAGGYCWTHRVQEFRGTLKSNLHDVCIPECRPPAAYLVTTAGTYELVLPRTTRDRIDRKWRDELPKLDGKEVIVRGTIRSWRNKYCGNRLRRCIRAYDLKLIAPCTMSVAN